MVSCRTWGLSMFLRVTRKRGMATPEKARAAMAEPVGAHTPPSRLRRRHRITDRIVEGFPCYTVAPRRAPDSGKVVIYLHGGSFFREISWWHWRFIDRLVSAGHRVEVPIYPLAPRYTYRAARPYLVAVYRQVIGEVDPGRVVLAGDSAGGTLALLLAQALPAAGLPAPARLILLAPCLDMRLCNPEIDGLEAADPWLARPGLLEAGRVWAGGDDLGLPELSPINGPMDGLPETDLFVGTHDILFPDARSFAEHAGARVHFTAEPGAFHVYPLAPVPEARPVLKSVLTTVDAL
ncbi:alpha/beta hydrolase fold domain-containing protein [Nocardia jinanensis]|uniref:Esterase n=1 Tax=Nocardia jinanensis TaxID=382504 RepID=A0A917VYM2_9NOCA|nr:alpha/beta hydrolase [Nocardia jinanensis]GGL45365.1 esterase [Nocardia jinanensis]